MEMVDFAPGMRTIIRDEEWMIKKIETNNLGNKTLYCVGISPLVKDREASFLTDLEQIQVVNPAEVKLVTDYSPFYKSIFRKSVASADSYRFQLTYWTSSSYGFDALSVRSG